MRTKDWLFLALTGAALTGCQSLKVQTAYDQKVDFSKLHSFCWGTPPAYLYNDPRLHMDMLEPIVHEDVDQQLHARGFVSTDCATADFQVNFRAALRDRIVEGRSPGDDGGGGLTIYEWNSETGGQLWTSRPPGEVNVERGGSLIILIMDPKTQRVMWNSTAMANLRNEATPQQRRERLATVIKTMMQNFPPGKSK